MLALAEAMSLEKPSNGWFIPNCDEEVPSFFDDAHAKYRREVRVQLFGGKESANVMQVSLLKAAKRPDHETHKVP